MTTVGKTLILSVCLLVAVACVPIAPESPDAIAAAAQARVAAENARATAESAEWQAVARENSLTATAEAPSVQMTATMAALEVYATRQVIDATATAQSWTPTPSQTPTPDITATLAVSQLHAEQTAIAQSAYSNVVLEELRLRRQAWLNNFYAALPGLVFVLISAALVLGIVWMVRSKRYQPAPLNANGDVIPVIDTTAHTVTDPRRMANASVFTADDIIRAMLMEYLRNKLQLPPMLPAVTAERQDKAVERAQMVEGLRVSAPTSGPRPSLMTSPLLTSPDSMSATRFDVVGDDAVGEIPPEIMQILEAQWRNV